MVANPINPLATVRGSENIETRLEPAREAVRDFDGFVELVVGGYMPSCEVFEPSKVKLLCNSTMVCPGSTVS